VPSRANEKAQRGILKRGKRVERGRGKKTLCVGKINVNPWKKKRPNRIERGTKGYGEGGKGKKKVIGCLARGEEKKIPFAYGLKRSKSTTKQEKTKMKGEAKENPCTLQKKTEGGAWTGRFKKRLCVLNEKID